MPHTVQCSSLSQKGGTKSYQSCTVRVYKVHTGGTRGRVLFFKMLNLASNKSLPLYGSDLMTRVRACSDATPFPFDLLALPFMVNDLSIVHCP